MKPPTHPKPPTHTDEPTPSSRLVTRDGEVWLLASDGVTWNFWGRDDGKLDARWAP